jgi:hypothetical protein
MRVLIVVYSFTRNNRLLARRLAERLGAEVVEVHEPRQRTMVTILLDLAFRRSGQIEPLSADPRSCDHVLFLAPLWNRHIATPMRAAMRQLAPEVGVDSFVTLCGGDRPRQSETVRLEATSAAGHPPLHQKEIWVEQQRAVTEDDLDAMKPEIDTIVGWFAPKGEGIPPP